MLEVLGNLSLLSHVIAGSATLIAGPIAIFYNFKNPKNHRRAGKVFFYAMLWVCGSAVVGFLKHSGHPFFQFLLGLSVIVFVGVVQGVRAIRLKNGGPVLPLDRAYTYLLLVTGVAMVGRAAQLFAGGGQAMFWILLAVFGTATIFDFFSNMKHFRVGAVVSPEQWYRMHLKCMFGAFTASTTAFFVQSLHFLPWPIQWFGPTLLLVPFQIYFSKKIADKKSGSNLDVSRTLSGTGAV